MTRAACLFLKIALVAKVLDQRQNSGTDIMKCPCPLQPGNSSMEWARVGAPESRHSNSSSEPWFCGRC